MSERLESYSRARRWANVLVVFLGCAGLLLATLVYAGYWESLVAIFSSIAAYVYTPMSIFLLLAIGVEYVVLKSADRTRLMQIELEKLRDKRRQEVTLLRETREGLEQLRAPRRPISRRHRGGRYSCTHRATD